MIIFYSFIGVIVILISAYQFYQIQRFNKIMDIFMSWVLNDKRDKVELNSINEMLEKNKSNLWGLRWPREKDYPPVNNQI